MSNNTKLGTGALQNNSGNNNTGIGAYASYDNTSSINNTAIGSNSSFFNTTGKNNTSVGAGSMCNNTTGSLNTALGSSALEGVIGQTVGNQNTAVGVQSLYNNDGDQNTAIGAYSGLDVLHGNYNTFLGTNATFDDLLETYNYSTAIGYNSKVSGSNQMMLGGENNLGDYPDVMIPGNAFLPNFTNTIALTDKQIVPKSYIDTVAAGLKITQSCICATTADISLDPSSNPPSTDATDNFDLGALTDGSYNILVVNQGLIPQGKQLTSNVDNGVYELEIVTDTNPPNTRTFTWARPPIPQPMSSGFDATGAFSFVQNGDKYGKSGLVQINGSPALVDTDALQYQTFYQFNFKLGQGLNITTSGDETFLNVDASLDFLTLVDSSTNSIPLNIGTTNATTINIGKENGSTTTNIYGSLNLTNSYLMGSTDTVLQFDTGTNDSALIKWHSTGDTGSYLQIGTRDNGLYAPDDEPIYFTQFESTNATTYARLRIDATGCFINPSTDPYTGSLFSNVPTANYQLNVNGNTNIKGDLKINTDKFTVTASTGNTNVGGTLDVTGATTLGTVTTGLATLNSASVTGTLGVTGTTTLGILGTTGLATLASASVTGTLGVTGATTLGTVTTGAATLGSASVTGTLGVTGLATLNSASVSTTLGVSGLATLNSASVSTTLGVTGATTLSSTLTVQNGAGKINLINTTSGANNLAIGQNSQNSTSGIRNHSFGIGTLYSNTSGENNSAFGFNTLYSNIDGSNNTAFGYEALYTNTSGYENSAFGVNSLLFNTSGHYNCAFGVGSLGRNTSGSNNNSFGRACLNDNTTGGVNNAFGTYALQFNLSGSNNCAFGHASLEFNNATGNSAFGAYSVQNNTTGINNSAFGGGTLAGNLTGNYNTCIGFHAGKEAINPSNCTFLGAATDFDVSSNNYSQSTAVGYNAIIDASNQIVLGTQTETVKIPGNTNIGGYLSSAGPYWRSSFDNGSGSFIDISANTTVLVRPTTTQTSDFSSGIINNNNWLVIPIGAYGIYDVTFQVGPDPAGGGGGFPQNNKFTIQVYQTTTTAAANPSNIILQNNCYSTVPQNDSGYLTLNITGLINYNSTNNKNYLSFGITNLASSSATFSYNAFPTVNFICIHKVA